MSSRFDKDSLLLSTRLKSPSYDPFCLFDVENYLPADLYMSLLKSFPDENWFVQKIEGDKSRLNSSHNPDLIRRFCQQHSEWGEFIDFLRSDAFMDDLHQLLWRGLVKSRGLAASRRWRDVNEAGVMTPIVRQPVRVQFEFSRLPKGSFVPPHTDAPEKLVSLLIYFPDPGWREDYGGGTNFYRALRGDAADNWDNRRVSFDDVATFASAPFTPNRIVGFLKSQNSYHGVRPITCPDEMARNSFNVNILNAGDVGMRHCWSLLHRAGWKAKRLLLPT